MRAWLLEGPANIEERPLRLAEVPTPEPETGEIRVRVQVCGVCRTDIHIAEGDLAMKKHPVTLGHEIVGFVDQVGKGVESFKAGDRVGVFWLHSTCGNCKYCRSDRENYCSDFRATGWHADGGFADYVTVPESSVLLLNRVRLGAKELAPVMCPGIAGYAALKLTGTRSGDRLGLYGFGPTAYFVLKAARFMGIDTYVSTRSDRHIEAAKAEGATWAADTALEAMPCRLDSAILFPPAGNLVEPALSQLQRGGTLVMAPVSSSRIVIENYTENLWGRDIRTLYNLNKTDATEFMGLVDQLGLRIKTAEFPFESTQDALIAAKQGKLTQPNAAVRVSG